MYYVFRVTDNSYFWQMQRSQETSANCSVPKANVHKCSGFSHLSYTECSGLVDNMFVPSLSIDLLGLQR